MAGHQAAAGILKTALGSRSCRLTEQDCINLIKQGLDSREALLDARDKSLEAILAHRGAVDAVLAWQAESKHKEHLGSGSACYESFYMSPILPSLHTLLSFQRLFLACVHFFYFSVFLLCCLASN